MDTGPWQISQWEALCGKKTALPNSIPARHRLIYYQKRIKKGLRQITDTCCRWSLDNYVTKQTLLHQSPDRSKIQRATGNLRFTSKTATELARFSE